METILLDHVNELGHCKEALSELKFDLSDQTVCLALRCVFIVSDSTDGL